MRHPVLAAVAALVLVAACSGSEGPASVDAALERDLRLASTSSITLAPPPVTPVTALETAPPAAEIVAAPRPRRAVSGPRRVSSPAATIAAAPEAAPAPEGDADHAITETAAGAPGEGEVEVADAGAALPRPMPVGFPAGGIGEGDGDDERGRGGPSAGDVIGGVMGAVIRGGVVDDCRVEPRGRRPVYRPGTAGPGESRWPASRPSVIRTRNDGERQRGGGQPIWRRQ